MAPLAFASYNANGHAADRLAYMDKLMLTDDVLHLQEHWLMNSRISSLESSLHNVHVHGVSSVPDNEIITGRPYGGTAIIWNKDFKCKITPISLSTVRACAVIINVHNIDVLLCSVYMPTDTTYDQENVYIYNDVLNDIVRASMEHDCHKIILGDDLNTLSLTEFMTNQYMKRGLSHVLSEVDYTYRSKINDECSTLDHFIMTENIFIPVNKMYYNQQHVHTGSSRPTP